MAAAAKAKDAKAKEFSLFHPSKPLRGKPGQLYPADSVVWKWSPDLSVVHDPTLPHNMVLKKEKAPGEKKKKRKKAGKEEADDDEEVAAESVRSNFLTLLLFIAFGVNRGGAALYPRLLDLEATAGNNTAGINAAIAYMQFHFKGVGVLPLRGDLGIK